MKKVLCICLTAVICVLLICPAFATNAAEEDTFYYFYDSKTGTSTSIPKDEYQTAYDDSDSDVALGSNQVARMLVWHFVSFDLEQHMKVDEYKEVETHRVDNRQSTTPTSVTLTLSSSGTVSASLTSSVGVSGELEGIIKKVKAETSFTVSSSASWTRGESISVSNAIPAGKVGYITVYIPGVRAGGTATYTVLDTSTDQVTVVERGLGGIVPRSDGYNIKVVHADS